MDNPTNNDTLQQEIEFEFSLKPDPDETLSQYVLNFEGSATVWDDEAAEDRTIGTMRGYRIDFASALHDGLDQVELLDSVSSELSDFASDVLKNETCYLPEPNRDTGEEKECEGLVYVSELSVDPAFRSRGVGSRLLQRIGAMLDVTNCLIALKAFPLADELGKPADPSYIAKVKHFYEKHGFKHSEGEFMVKDASLCEAMKKRMAKRKKQ